MKIEIHEMKDHVWCEVQGTYIYGKNREELTNALNSAFNGNEVEAANNQTLSCNR